MLRYSLVFLVVALLAGVCGFTELAGGTWLIAKVLFFLFLMLFVVSLFFGQRNTPGSLV